MKNFYKSMILALALLLPLQSYAERKPYDFLKSVRQKTQVENISPAAAVQNAGAARDGSFDVKTFPFEQHLTAGYNNFTVFIPAESMLKIKLSNSGYISQINDNFSSYISIDPEIEIHLRGGRHLIVINTNDDADIIMSLGDKVYTEVGDPQTHDITLPFKSGTINFDQMADTVKLNMEGYDVFRRAVIYRFTAPWEGSRILTSTLSDDKTRCCVSRDIQRAVTNVSKGGFEYAEGGVNYLAVLTSAATTSIELTEYQAPTAAETFKNVQKVSIPSAFDVTTGNDVFYWLDDLEQEYPSYYSAYSFTLTKETELFFEEDEEYERIFIVRPDAPYYDNLLETLDFYWSGPIIYGTLPAGTYYLVAFSEEPNSDLGRWRILDQKPDWLLSSYTEVDYSEVLASEKKFGEFHDGDKIWDGDYVKGYTMNLTAGNSYQLLPMAQTANGNQSVTLTIMGGGTLTGDSETDFIENTTLYDGRGLLFTPETSGQYRLLVRIESYHTDLMYSLEMKQMQKVEHFRPITLPAAIDTVTRSGFAMEENSKYSYTWKFNLTSADKLLIGGNWGEEDIPGHIKITTADGTEVTEIYTGYNGYNGTISKLIDLEAGEYTLHAWWYNSDDYRVNNKHLQLNLALAGQLNMFESEEAYHASLTTQTLPAERTVANDFTTTMIASSDTYVFIDAIKFEVGEGTYQLNIGFGQCYRFLYKVTDDGLTLYAELFDENEYRCKSTAVISEPGTYILSSGAYYAAFGQSATTTFSLTSLNNVKTLREVLDAQTEYNATIPGTIAGTLTDKSDLVKLFADYDDIYAVNAYKVDLNSLEKAAVLNFKANDFDSETTMVLFFDESYNLLSDGDIFITSPGDYYLVVASPSGNSNVSYSLDAELDPRDMTNDYAIVGSITSATALPADVTMKLNDQSPYYNQTSDLYSGTVKVTITADNLGTADGGFITITSKDDNGLHFKIVTPSLDYIDGGYINGQRQCRITAPGDYYIITYSPYVTTPHEYKLSISFIPESNARPEDAITVLELIQQTQDVINNQPNTDKFINTSVLVKGGGINGNDDEYFFADAYKINLPATENDYLWINQISTYYDTYLYTSINGSNYVNYGIWNDPIVTNGFTEYEVESCIVIAAPRSSADVYSIPYNLCVTKFTVSTLDEILRQTTQTLTLPATVSGTLITDADTRYINTSEEPNVIDPSAIKAYKMELNEGDQISYASNLRTSLYYYNPESDSFERYYSSTMDYTGTYYIVVSQQFYGSIEPVNYTLNIESTPRAQRVMSVVADPQAIIVEASDNEIAIRMSLAEQVTLTAMMETGNRTILAHTAFDWVVSSDKSSAEYVLPAEYETVSGEEIRVTVMINQEKVKIKATAGANGNINPAGDIEVFKGTDQIFEITADNGYVIDAVTVNGTTVKSGLEGRTMGTYKLENMQEGMTLNVTFILNSEKPIESYTVDINVNDESMGSVTITGGDKLSDGTYLNGSQIAIRAIASNGYRFVRWSDGKIEPYREMTVIENINLTAIFEDANQPVTFSVTIVSDDEKMGRVRISGDEPVSGDNIYVQGAEIQARAIANEGYVFDSWSDGTTTPDISITVSKNIRLTAFFTKTSAVENHTDDKYVIYGKDGVLYVTGETGKSEIVVRTIMGCEIYRGTNRAISIGIPGIYLVTIDNVTQKAVIR